jgi:hypothetical protein
LRASFAALVLFELCRQLLFAAPARPVNNSRFVFLDPRVEAFYRD